MCIFVRAHCLFYHLNVSQNRSNRNKTSHSCSLWPWESYYIKDLLCHVLLMNGQSMFLCFALETFHLFIYFVINSNYETIWKLIFFCCEFLGSQHLFMKWKHPAEMVPVTLTKISTVVLSSLWWCCTEENVGLLHCQPHLTPPKKCILQWTL